MLLAQKKKMIVCVPGQVPLVAGRGPGRPARPWGALFIV